MIIIQDGPQQENEKPLRITGEAHKVSFIMLFFRYILFYLDILHITFLLKANTTGVCLIGYGLKVFLGPSVKFFVTIIFVVPMYVKTSS